MGFFSDFYKKKYVTKESQIRMFFDELFVVDDVYKLFNDLKSPEYNSNNFLWRRLNNAIDFIIISNKNPSYISSSDLKEIILIGFKTLIKYKKSLKNKDGLVSEINQTDCKEVLDFMKDLLIKKNHDYGDSFGKSVKKFGIIYAAIEIDKKKNRLLNLLRNKHEVNYEGIDDTISDILGYFILTYLFLSFDR